MVVSTVREVPEMAMRHDDLTEEQLELKHAYERSWDNAQRQLADPEFRAYLEASIERVNTSCAQRVGREGFLAATEAVDPE
jgi:hypothetical protein